MRVAYVDTSALLSIAFDEPGARVMADRLERYDALLASNLLEAEYRASLRREDVPADVTALSWVKWVLPDRALSSEFEQVLEAAFVRGADLLHLATALYVSPTPGDVAFVTLDDRQREAARAVGFSVDP